MKMLVGWHDVDVFTLLFCDRLEMYVLVSELWVG